MGAAQEREEERQLVCRPRYWGTTGVSVLVTGGAGYVGSVAVELLVAANERVVVLDSLCRGYRAAVAPEAVFVAGDIRDVGLVRDLLAAHHVDTVMHFAAFIEVGESCAAPAAYFENNLEGAHSVLKAMIASPSRRFILSSTAAVYGNPESVPIKEEAPTRPVNPYGLSKLMSEQVLDWYGKAYGLQFISLRYFNACGATPLHGEDHRPETHLIPNAVLAALGTQNAVTVFGTDYPTHDGTCERDYIHVADLAEAHLKAMTYLRDGGASAVLNLGNSQAWSVLQVIEAVKRLSGKDFPVVYSDRRPGDAVSLVASSEKARRILDWRPQRSDLDTMVRDAWEWRRAHPMGYQS